MTKKKSALAQIVPHTQWSQIQASQRITYPEGPPDRMSWRTQDTYTGAGLSYRGQQERRPIVSLAGQPL